MDIIKNKWLVNYISIFTNRLFLTNHIGKFFFFLEMQDNRMQKSNKEVNLVYILKRLLKIYQIDEA